MNNIHDNGEYGKSLNEGLNKLDHAYGQLPNEEPPELIDQAILNSAHRAVEKRPHWMKFGWLHGLTTAAVFVLALSLTFNQREQVPSYEGEPGINMPVGQQRETTAKKRSLDVSVDEQDMESKEKAEYRQDVFQDSPAPAAPQSQAMESVAEDQSVENQDNRSAPGVQLSTFVRKDPRAETDRVEKDESINEPLVEEYLVDEAELAADHPGAETFAGQALPAAVSESKMNEAETATVQDPEIERQLLAIIKLKQSGDEAWISELELFRQSYPDYPLPAELSE